MMYFSSDSHAFHTNILRYCKDTRPFESVEEMNAVIIKGWNSVVSDKDEIYHLGDLSFGDALQTRELLRQLRGKKHLVLGDHDKVIRSNRDIQGYFASVQEYKELKYDKKRIVLSHFPFLSWNGSYRGSWHLHGHSHNGLFEANANVRRLDVGVDSVGFIPISIEAVADTMKAKIVAPQPYQAN